VADVVRQMPSARLTAPHPNPLPALMADAEASAVRGERETRRRRLHGMTLREMVGGGIAAPMLYVCC